MRIAIETYRDWDIYFDTSNEHFFALSSSYDKQQESKSFSAIKKRVDDFIKENVKFKPLDIEPVPNIHRRSNRERLRVIGVRKDGRFVVETKAGDKRQLGNYELMEYMLINPENEQHWKDLKDIQGQIEELQ